MNLRSLRNPSTWLAALAAASLLTTAAAQTAATDEKKAEEAVKLEKFVVTGSLIKRIADEGALPVQILSPVDLEKQGVTSVEQMIMNLNINGNGLDNLASNSDVVSGATRGNNGATSANLRGQGSNATLILLNGRRVSSHGLNGGVVDLNQIPFAAIARVEILKDGASSIYGTDAIGGVINFILRENFQGVSISSAADVTQLGGGNVFRYSAVAGIGDIKRDKYNVMASFAVSDSKKLRGAQRDFVNTFQPSRGLSPDTRGTPIATLFAVSSTLFNALSRDNLTNAGRGTGPVDPADAALRVNGINIVDLPGGPGYTGLDGMGPYDEVLWNSPASKYGSAWDTGRAAVLQQPVKNTNLVTRATVMLGQHKVTAEGVFGRSVSTKSFSPNQWSTSGNANTTAPDGVTILPNPLFNLAYPSTGADYNRVFNALVAYFPALEVNRGLPLEFRWRSIPLGNRAFTTTTDTYRYMAGIEGPLGFLADWDYRLGATRNSSKGSSLLVSGYVYSVPFTNLINTGVVSPFVYKQTDAAMTAINQIRADGVRLYGGTFTTDQFDFTASGPVVKMPGGDLMGAVGMDWRKESFTFAGDQRSILNTAAALIFNAPFDNALATNGPLSRTIKAVYGEVNIPVLKELQLNLSARIDEYTGFGRTTNPKVSFLYKISDQIRWRGSYSTGFRVPTFKQEYDPVTISPIASTGLIDPATGLVIAPNSANTIFGGKADLKPETAKLISVGLAVEPSSNFNLSADWWLINRKGTIQTFDVTTLLANYSLFTDRFRRRADGTIDQVDIRWVNAGETIQSGIDFNANAKADVAGGKLTGGFELTYLLEKRSRLLSSAPFGQSELNQFTRSSDIGIQWKHTAFVDFRKGNWSARLSQLYRGSYTDAVLPGVANGRVVPPNWKATVKPYDIFNASVTYSGFKNMTIRAGIKNLFNTDPPFSATYDTNTGAGSSWEPRVADPRGRAFTLSVDYKFL